MHLTHRLQKAVWLKWTPLQKLRLQMDFQLARNLSALSRAQQEIAQALLHIDSLSDCINREIIMLPVQKQLSSWWLQPKQLFSRFRTCWRRNQMKGPVDFVRLKSPSSQRAENAPLVHRRPMSLSLIARSLTFRCLGDRVVLLKESLLVRATPLRRPPYEAVYGVMMSRDESERTSF